jgi:hypothetical protein|tara:strand:+ start:433 stop:558 length:126 start_codon:yes stop_codon:yes gene_type:complete
MMSEIMHCTPFVLSLSKDSDRQQPHFDKPSANGSIQGKLIP